MNNIYLPIKKSTHIIFTAKYLNLRRFSMKKPIAIFLLFTFSTYFLISCKGKGSESSSNLMRSENLSTISSSESETIEENSLETSSEEEILPLYTDIMPPLTPEEEAKVNDIVTRDFFGSFNSEGLGGAKVGEYSRIFEKNYAEITYGDLWRFTNRGEMLLASQWMLYDTNNNWVDFDPQDYSKSDRAQMALFYSELKNVHSIEISQFSLPNHSFDYDAIWKMTWVDEFSVDTTPVSLDSIFEIFPEGVKNLRNLKTFTANVSNIMSFPDVFDQLEKLEYFSCTYNYLEELPPSFYRLPNLKELDLDQNPLTLSPEIAQMQSLEVLTLPSIYEYPDELGELKNLKELYIKSSRYTLQEEREDVATRTEIKLTESPERILLGSLMSVRLPPKYAVLPEGIGGLENLEKLECWYVKDPLPESIGNLKNLEGLNLSGEIIYLPESIGNLKNLAWIRISSELFTSLPESFGDLQSLISINFADDNLEETAWAMIEAKKQ